ncbi:MAG: response regulator transcription factor [Acidobacteriota bacterium]|nr:response regulator transcription factor [Acidobacteriota bacterium]
MDADCTLLLVDDDRELCALIAEFLAPRGYRTEPAHDGREALAQTAHKAFDLIVLDVMLPVLDGFEVLRQIRKRSAVPVVMLTARTARSDMIDGLNSGADDYLPKPFEPEELLARIRAVLRRAGKSHASDIQQVECGGVRLDSRTREVWLGGMPVAITAIEFDILECLMRSAGRLVSRDALAAVLYQRESTPYERAIDVHISHLRRKLERDGETLIHTMRGSGYFFAARHGPAA